MNEEMRLKAVIDDFIGSFESMNFNQIAIRDPPSKHQRELRKLIDLVNAFKYNVQLNEGKQE